MADRLRRYLERKGYQHGDMFRLLVGAFNVLLAWAVAANLDKGTAAFMPRLGISPTLFSLLLSFAGALLIARRWKATWFYVLTMPTLAYGFMTLLYTINRGLTPVPALFQIGFVSLIMAYTYERSGRNDGV